MKKLRFFLSLALSILLLIPTFPTSVGAEDDLPTSGVCGENVTWRLVENEDSYWAYNDKNDTPVENEAEYGTEGTHFETRCTLLVEGTGATDDYNYEGKPDEWTPQPWTEFSWQISRADFGEGVTRVGDSFLRWSNNLRHVSLPDSLREIGAFAFEGCVSADMDEEGHFTLSDGLRKITIPDGVSYIAGMAFANNHFLTTVNFAGDLEDVCLAGEEEFAGRHPAERVREVFNNTPWFDNWMNQNYMSGDCGEDATWRLVENEDGFWAYNDEQGTPVTNPDDENTNDTHFEKRYTLIIEGTGAIADFYEDENHNVLRPWDAMRWEISRVEIKEGITRIGESAFRWHDNLRIITLPDSLREIGAFAFESCNRGYGDEHSWTPVSGLEEITIPDGVIYIGGQAFAHNPFFDTLRFTGDVEAVCLAGDEEYADRHPAERVREVFNNTPWFDNWMNENYMSGVCGENATWRLVENADGFWAYNDEQNTPVTNPDDENTNDTHFEKRYTLIIEGTGAIADFYEDENHNVLRPWDAMRWEISRVQIGDGITRVGDSAFRRHDNLRTVTLPDSLREIGAFAFESCNRGEGDEHSWTPVSGLEEITIPDGVTYIAGMAFANNHFLTTVNFGGDIEAVCLAGEEEYADRHPAERVREVFNNTPWFDNWMNENYMSGSCGETATWRLVENADGFWAYNDEQNTPVTNPDDENTNGTHLEKRYTLIIEGTGAIADFYENENHNVLRPWDAMRWEISRVEIKEGITRIGESAFRRHDNLRIITLPDSLREIGAFAFESCNRGYGDEHSWTPVSGLEEITIPDGVTYIAGMAFANNHFLTTVNFGGDIEAVCLAGEEEYADRHPAERVREVFNNTPWFDNWMNENYMSGSCGETVTWRLEKTGEGVWFHVDDGSPVEDPAEYGAEGTAYADFYRLVITGTGATDDFENGIPSLDFFGINVREAVVEEGVTRIGENAFARFPELREVYLPTSLKSIGANAFRTNENLTDVYYAYPGTREDWDKIAVDSGNGWLLNAELHLHTHTPGQAVKEGEVPASCETGGSYQLVVCCEDCGAELSRTTVETEPLGHDYGKPEYVWSEDNAVCTAKAVCARDKTHVLEERRTASVRRNDPTCTEDGVADYYAHFENELFEAQTKTVVLSATGHAYGDVTYIWAEDLSYCTAERVCKNDKTHVWAEKSEKTDVQRTEPTCTEDGKIVYTARFGNKSLSTQIKTVTLPALGHDYKTVTVAPTCTEGGKTTHTCTRCGDAYTTDEIPATGHSPAKPVRENEKPATPDTPEEWDEVVYCAVCKTLLSRTHKTGQTLPSAETAAPGDVDLDGEVTAADARLALRRAVELDDHLTAVQLRNADVDGEAGVSAADARLILRAAVGLENPKNWPAA